jgi:uncharacterized protein YPO0396
MPGQWRLSSIELINWGTFNNYHMIEVSRRGMVITGASGSGKSTLLDAVTTVMCPPGKRHYNAAAQSGQARGDDRTIISYIRGAHGHESQPTGEISSTYLRDRAATYSAILLRFENGQNAEGVTGGAAQGSSGAAGAACGVVNLLGLFHLKAGVVTRDGLTQMFAVLRGDCHAPDFVEFIQSSADIAAFNRAYNKKTGALTGKAYKEFSQYASHFCRVLGIQNQKTLELLHKTQAAKNFGSLDELFRNFMLDRPKTFDLRDAAVEEFNALKQAHESVVDQRQQLDALRPLDEIAKSHAEHDAQAQHLAVLCKQLNSYTNSLVTAYFRKRLSELETEHDSLNGQLTQASVQLDLAARAYDAADYMYRNNNGIALETTRKDLLMDQLALEDTRKNVKRLAADIRGIDGLDMPTTQAEFDALVRKCAQFAADGCAARAKLEAEQTEHNAQCVQLRQQIKAVQNERDYLLTRKSNIPQKYNKIRMEVAHDCGLNADDLPFFGELVSVAPDEESWHGALERLIGKNSLIMLVPAANANAVARYVNGHNLGLRFEYEVIGGAVEVPQRHLNEASAVRKFNVARSTRHPEFAMWINRELREHYDYICVDGVDDLPKHAFALTQAGLIKRRGRHVKDDRFNINDVKHWMLGTSNEQKIDALEIQLEALRAEEKTATQNSNQVRNALRAQDAIVRLKDSLTDASWELLDVRAKQEAVERTEKFIEKLETDSPSLKYAADCRDEAAVQKKSAEEAFAHVKSKLIQNENAISELCAKQADAMNEADAVFSEADAAELKEYFVAANKRFDASDLAILKTSNKVRETIESQRTRAVKKCSELEVSAAETQTAYKSKWQAAAANLTTSFADIENYLLIMRQIESSRLPEYEKQFLDVLNEFSRDRITALSMAIRGAISDVREKLRPVNASLKMSEYSSGHHLQIEVRDSRSIDVKKFLAEMQGILQDSWARDSLAAAEERYAKLNKIIGRLSSDNDAERRRANACLDTRLHMNFIAKEIDAAGNAADYHVTDAGLSGGQKQKLVVFCLAAALRYQLAEAENPIPTYATVILDEAFDKADTQFAKTTMDIFETFGFHMILATPHKLLRALEPYVGAYAVVVRNETTQESSVSPVNFWVDGAGACSNQAGNSEASDTFAMQNAESVTDGMTADKGGAEVENLTLW